MKNNVIANNMKSIKNRIILNNLTEKQKEVLMKTGLIGGGLTSGLFMLYSMKDPETIPCLYTDSTPLKDLTESSDGELNNSIEIVTLKPVTEISEQNISFGEAFKVARELCGPGGWFIWKGNIYNTYYKEEWKALSQEEKNDYLASIEIENIKNQDEKQIKNNVNDNSNEEIIATNNDAKEDIETENNVYENEISIDLKSHNELKYNTQENFSAENNNLITGEFITLDDDSEIIDNDYFELSDDIEIVAISDEESNLIDQLTFDSSEFTSFPWEISDEVTENEISENEIDTIVNEPDISKESATDKITGENDEYLLGKSVSQTTENETEIQVLEEIKPDDMDNIIRNPEEIKEYPLYETQDNSYQNTENSNSEITLHETDEKLIQNKTETLHEIEEYPWGEKIDINELEINSQIIVHENEDINLEKDNIGVILPEETKTDSLIKLPPSFDEITEFPWGETVPHSPVDPYSSPENDLFENPTNQNNAFTGDNE